MRLERVERACVRLRRLAVLALQLGLPLRQRGVVERVELLRRRLSPTACAGGGDGDRGGGGGGGRGRWEGGPVGSGSGARGRSGTTPSSSPSSPPACTPTSVPPAAPPPNLEVLHLLVVPVQLRYSPQLLVLCLCFVPSCCSMGVGGQGGGGGPWIGGHAEALWYCSSCRCAGAGTRLETRGRHGWAGSLCGLPFAFLPSCAELI